MRISNILISGSLLSALAFATPALAQGYTMIMAHTLSDNKHPIYQAFNRLETEIEQRSNGRIDVIDQGGGALGGDRETIEGAIFGDIQFAPMSSSAAVQFVPELAVFDILYIMPADKDARYALLNQGPPADAISVAMEAKGLKFMGIMDDGFRNLTSKDTEVHSPADIAAAGLRVRVQENPYGHILSQRFYEVQRYLINTNHILLANVNAVSLVWHDSLPEDLQEAVGESFAVATKFEWGVQAELQDSQRA
ncbi:MAG: TRAP transporter substrate-binding protein [Candidatus Devosia euplotis]|nr:TRAP transporter substrate-binding protein [Candidatus Devosia euplotis]